jgi:hypothetical protein
VKGPLLAVLPGVGGVLGTRFLLPEVLLSLPFLDLLNVRRDVTEP